MCTYIQTELKNQSVKAKFPSQSVLTLLYQWQHLTLSSVVSTLFVCMLMLYVDGNGKVHLAFTVTPPWLFPQSSSWIPKIGPSGSSKTFTLSSGSPWRETEKRMKHILKMTQLVLFFPPLFFYLFIFSFFSFYLPVHFMFFCNEVYYGVRGKTEQVATGVQSAQAVASRSQGVILFEPLLFPPSYFFCNLWQLGLQLRLNYPWWMQRIKKKKKN